MKTLSINPFNLKTTIKNYVRNHRTVKHVEMPKDMKPEMLDKLMGAQNSLDYMATNYGIKFGFGGINDNITFVTCKKGNMSVASEDISEKDSQADIAQKIYQAASSVL